MWRIPRWPRGSQLKQKWRLPLYTKPSDLRINHSNRTIGGGLFSALQYHAEDVIALYQGTVISLPAYNVLKMEEIKKVMQIDNQKCIMRFY